jgi:hypothetical protein
VGGTDLSEYGCSLLAECCGYDNELQFSGNVLDFLILS